MMTNSKTILLSSIIATTLLLTTSSSYANPTGDEILLDVSFGTAQVSGLPVTVRDGVEYSASTTSGGGDRGGQIDIDIGDGIIAIHQNGTPSTSLLVKISDIDWLDDDQEIPGEIDSVTCDEDIALKTPTWTSDSITIESSEPTPQREFTIDCVFTVIHEPITPQGLIQSLIEEIETLVEDGELAPENDNGLIPKLEGAIKNLDNEEIEGACGKIGAFINQIEAFVSSGHLDSIQGQELIDAANAIRVLIEC